MGTREICPHEFTGSLAPTYTSSPSAVLIQLPQPRAAGPALIRLDLFHFNQSINQSKRKTSNANGQTNLGHKHKAPDHNHEATQPMVDLPHTS